MHKKRLLRRDVCWSAVGALTFVWWVPSLLAVAMGVATGLVGSRLSDKAIDVLVELTSE